MVGLTAIVLASFMPALLIFHAAVPDAGSVSDGIMDMGAAAFAIIGYGIAVRRVEKRPLIELQPRLAVRELLIGIVIGTLLFSLVMAILVGLHAYRVVWIGIAPAWKATGVSVRAGVIEEIVFRGVIFRLLWSAFGVRTAFVVSAGLFGVIHFLNPGTTILSALSIALEAGVMLGAFYALTGRIWVSIGVHGAWDFAQSYLFGAIVSGQDLGRGVAHSLTLPGSANWLTGGAFGPEASIVAILVCGAAGAIAIALFLQRQRSYELNESGWVLTFRAVSVPSESLRIHMDGVF